MEAILKKWLRIAKLVDIWLLEMTQKIKEEDAQK